MRAFALKGHPLNGWKMFLRKEWRSQLNGAGAHVCSILPPILSLKAALQAVWNPSLFAQKEAEGLESQPGREPLSLEATTSAIRSQRWWLETELVMRLNSFGSEFASWAEGCDCHAWLRQPTLPKLMCGSSSSSQKKPSLTVARRMLGLCAADGGDGVGHVCPFAGRRSAHLDCGAVEELFSSLSGVHLQDLRLAGVRFGVEGPEINEVIAAFVQGATAMQACARNCSVGMFCLGSCAGSPTATLTKPEPVLLLALTSSRNPPKIRSCVAGSLGHACVKAQQFEVSWKSSLRGNPCLSFMP